MMSLRGGVRVRSAGLPQLAETSACKVEMGSSVSGDDRGPCRGEGRRSKVASCRTLTQDPSKVGEHHRTHLLARTFNGPEQSSASAPADAPGSIPGDMFDRPDRVRKGSEHGPAWVPERALRSRAGSGACDTFSLFCFCPCRGRFRGKVPPSGPKRATQCSWSHVRAIGWGAPRASRRALGQPWCFHGAGAGGWSGARLGDGHWRAHRAGGCAGRAAVARRSRAGRALPRVMSLVLARVSCPPCCRLSRARARGLGFESMACAASLPCASPPTRAAAIAGAEGKRQRGPGHPQGVLLGRSGGPYLDGPSHEINLGPSGPCSTNCCWFRPNSGKSRPNAGARCGPGSAKLD